MKDNKITLRQFIEKFDNGEFDSKSTDIQCDAGWYDWFCKDSSLRNKTYSLTKKIKQLLPSSKINQDTMYVFFKNNCPCVGKLYDDFRFCDMETGEVIYTICPAVGYTKTFGRSEVWGKENDFKEAIVAGTWNDVLFFFLGVDKKKEREEKRIAVEERKKEKDLLKDEWAVREYLINQIEDKTVSSDNWYEFTTVKLIKISLAL
ncbi:MAG TPA: hypothetical protein PK171_04780 [Atribacter sp.]|nr:hypothetical protein [Atribacter sp.]